MKKRIIIGYYFFIFGIIMFACLSLRWYKLDNSGGGIKKYEIEEKIKLTEIKNPQPDTRYYRKYEIIKTYKCGTFPFIIISKNKKYIGSYESSTD